MIGATVRLLIFECLILNLAIDIIDNKFKGASTNFTLVNLHKMRSTLALFLGVATAIKITCQPCGDNAGCEAPIANQLNCPCVENDGQGYG